MLRWLVLLIALSAGSCALSRDLDDSSGAHPLEWSVAGSADSHDRWLLDNGYPLLDCQRCHGRDYLGGDVEVSCATAGCHPLGVEECGTCHGQYDDALPRNLAHERHAGFCVECHPMPERVDDAGHIDGTVDIEFAGAAIEEGRSPQWIATTGQCSGMATACHAESLSNPWNSGTTSQVLPAGFAHEANSPRL